MAQTDYQRHKARIERLRAKGIHRRIYHQCEADIQVIDKVKQQLTTATGQPATNDMAMATIIAFYRLSLELDAD